MIPQRVIFLSDVQDAPEIDQELLAEFRSEIEKKILRYGSDDAESIPLPDGLGMGFLTTLPRPKIGRVMARWAFENDEVALVTGLRAGDASYEEPPEDF